MLHLLDTGHFALEEEVDRIGSLMHEFLDRTLSSDLPRQRMPKQVNTLLTKQLPEVAWGNFAHFVEYTGVMTSLFPSSLTVSFAWAATVAETLFGILLIAGFKIRMASVLSGLLLLSFAIGMVTGLGIKTPFDYSVFSAAAAAFLLAFWEPDRFTLDKLLNRLRN